MYTRLQTMAKLRVLFEAGPMVDKHKTGVGYFVDYLVQSLAKTDSVDLTGYYFDFLGKNKTPTPTLKNTRFERISLIPGKTLSVTRRLGWQPPLGFFTKTSNYHVTLFTNYVSLPTSLYSKVALIVYDLGFIDHPDFTEQKNLAYLESFSTKSIQSADLIITISEFTKKRIKELFPHITCPIIVTPIPPVSPPPYPLEKESSILKKFSLNRHKYILYLGTIEPRKNLKNLIIAYSLLPEKIRSTHPLVLAGGKGWKDEEIRQAISDYQSKGYNIITTGYITDEEKAVLYKNTACFTLPSHYEGFGMPILEAMQYSIPVAISDIPVFHEVAGQAAVYFNQDDPDSIATTISKLLDDAKLRQNLARHQSKELAKYSWKSNANLVIKAFQALIDEK
ncbi:glycosyltransferase family 1 protein [Candidatus Saccharibacteria bacterium oral taxon 955]